MSSFKILKDEGGVFAGCDFVVQLPREREGSEVRILQLTDMQIIDSLQRRTPDRIRPDEIEAWLPEHFDALCGNHIRSLVAQSVPDLIIITGDIVYGSFDDAGSTMRYLCELLDSFGIPWAPVFGNHDNETQKGVAWQCEQFAQCRFCLFKRGNVSGNGNYTVGVAIGDTLIRVLHMLDSNGCKNESDPDVIREAGLYPDQLNMVQENTEKIRKAQEKDIPAFMAFHIPVDIYRRAEHEKGYRHSDEDKFVLGVDTMAKDGDFGFSLENRVHPMLETELTFIPFLRSQNVEGVFVGHFHNCCSSIRYEDIVWTFGMKTGQYDYHVPYQIGGMLISLVGTTFRVNPIHSLAPCGAMPKNAVMFRGMFVTGEI